MTRTNSHSSKTPSRAEAKSSARSKKGRRLISADLLGRWRNSSIQKSSSNGRHGSSPRRTASRKDHQIRQAKSPATPPPVMARSYNVDMPFTSSEQYTKKNRRRVDVPLNIPGAEIRLPSLPTFQMSTKWLSLFLVLILLGGLYLLWSVPFFRVNGVNVEGNARVKAGDVNAVLGIEGKPVITIRPNELQKKLLDAFPEFSSADVQVSLPNSVNVTVTERVPVLTWRQGGQTQLVDTDGYIFPLRLEATKIISPVVEATGAPPLAAKSTEDILSAISGSAASQEKAKNENATGSGEMKDEKPDANTPFIKPEMVKAILAMSKVIPVNAPLIYDPDHGFGWQDQRGWKVYLGDDQDVDMKLNLYEAIVKSLEDEQIQPVLISVEHVHNPYYRVE